MLAQMPNAVWIPPVHGATLQTDITILDVDASQSDSKRNMPLFAWNTLSMTPKQTSIIDGLWIKTDISYLSEIWALSFCHTTNLCSYAYMYSTVSCLYFFICRHSFDTGCSSPNVAENCFRKFSVDWLLHHSWCILLVEHVYHSNTLLKFDYIFITSFRITIVLFWWCRRNLKSKPMLNFVVLKFSF